LDNKGTSLYCYKNQTKSYLWDH